MIKTTLTVRKKIWLVSAIILGLVGVAGCSDTNKPADSAAAPSAKLGASNDASTGVGAGENWPTPGGDMGKTHYSTLTSISRDNVSELGFAWELKLGTQRGLEATPVVIDGVMVTSGNLGKTYALDAATGKEIWRFEPDVDMQVNRTACCDQVNRGVAVKNGKVYVAAFDGILNALDLKTGKVLWQANTVADPTNGLNITGAPEIAGDVVIIGNGGAEFDTRGYVTAYDLNTGEQRWRFFTVPRDPALGPQENPEIEEAVKTWDANSRWDIGGGGTVWDAIHYDPEFDAVYIGVGNGGPYLNTKRSPSGGDNLFLSSIVALDPKTGRVKWHYQETPMDSWDYTATQPMVLTDLDIDGESVPVILHAPKNGFMYVIDRRNGKVLRASSLVYQTWADGVDLETGRPNMTPEYSDYSTGPKIVFPASSGARNWHPASFNPETGLYYAAVVDMGNLIWSTPGQKPHRVKGLNNDAALMFSTDIEAVLPTFPAPMREAIEALPAMKRVRENPATSELRAIEPLTGETVWSVPLKGWQDRSGVLTTAGGLLFQGDVGGNLSVFDLKTGELLKTIATGTAIMAAPMTYKVNGEQYVAVMAGWGGGGWSFVPAYSAAYRYSNEGRILAFKLNGAETPLPEPLPPLTVAPPPPPQAEGVTPEIIAKGASLFFGNCAICHSNKQRSVAVKDLSRMQPGSHTIFKNIVLDGAFLPLGMPRWDDLLSEEDVEAIHAYLIDLQAKTHAKESKLVEEGKSLDPSGANIMTGY